MIIATRKTIAEDLQALGVSPGDILCVHSSLKSLGLVIGGPRVVVEALIDAVGPAGSVMMPSYSGDLSDPAEWRHPPVTAEQIDFIRSELPPYDPQRTPTRGMGQIAEYFRTWPGTRRSPHPQSSFAAYGAKAEALVASHPYDDRFGPSSPLGRLCDMRGKVLLLGAPANTTSLFHMTQHLVPNTAVEKAAPVMERGEKIWARYRDIEYPIDWFDEGMAALITQGIAARKKVCAAPSLLFSAQAAIDFLIPWRQSGHH